MIKCAVIFGSLLAFSAACSSSKNSPSDSSVVGDTASNNDGNATTDAATGSDSTTNTGSDGSSETSGGTCASTASAFCAKLSTCRPNLLAEHFTDVATCTTYLTNQCKATTTDIGEGSISGCQAAETALACPAFNYLNQQAPLAACTSVGTGKADNTGDPTLGGACFENAQCVAHANCIGYTSTANCGGCETTLTTGGGDDCSYNQNGVTPDDTNCDVRAGAACVAQFSATASDHIDTTQTTVYTCVIPTYATTVGASCAPGTNLLCGPGFFCGATYTCQTRLTTGTECDTVHTVDASDPCDIGAGDACTADATGNTKSCQAPVLVGIGAQCGSVTTAGKTVNQICKGQGLFSFCNTAGATPICTALVAQGATCTVTPNNCGYGLGQGALDCVAGVCTTPDAGTTATYCHP